MHFRRLTCLTVAAMAIGAAGTTADAFAGSLTGAGSTLVAPLMSRWAGDFQSRTGNSVTYSGIGSGGGISAIVGNTVDFGASDAPLSANTKAASCTQCVQIPWALSATALGFHVNNLRKLKLTPGVIASIYLGQIKNWSDPQITRLNRGVQLPNLAITPVYRTDGSGDSYAFTDFLSRTSRAWAGTRGPATTAFPNAGVGTGGKGNQGVQANVVNINGAIGYISASYLILNGLPAAAIQNRAGKFEYPNLNNIAAAAKAVRSVPGNNELHIVNPPRSAKAAYPLSTFTYVIARHDGAQKGLLASFINYVLGPGAAFGPALDFPPLPSVVKAAARRAAASL